MKCTACGYTIPLPKTTSAACMACGTAMKKQADDFLLHGANGIVREVRPGQVEMGRLTERVIAEENFAVVEGPVGIGKSFAYSIPAILSGKRVVISTAKKQLQHQLAQKDLPFLAERLEKSVAVALVKGKSNYACKRKGVGIVNEADRKAFLEWLDESASGDLSDLPGKKPSYWNDVTAEDCVGTQCRFAKNCAYQTSRDKIKTANIVVANHHVVAWDLRYGPRKILGEYDVLIIDEAHQALSALRSAYSKTVSPGAVKPVLRIIDKIGFSSAVSDKLDSAWATMFNRIRHLDGEITPNPFGDDGDECIELLTTLRGEVRKDLATRGVDTVAAYDPYGDDLISSPNTTISTAVMEEILDLTMLQKAIERPLEALKELKDPASTNTVIYIDSSNKRHKTVHIAPIDIGPLVGPKLSMLSSVIVTSATIAINRTFDAIKAQLGLDRVYAPDPAAALSPRMALTAPNPHKRVTEELVLETPFDYAKQALLYLPRTTLLPVAGSEHSPSPERVKYINVLARECKRLITSSNGNAFILFTATQDMRDVHAALAEEQLPNKLVLQEDDAEATLREFMATKYSVILGLKSFWEGVDVVGDKLRLVVVTKLPFPIVNDPVNLARSRAIKKDAVSRGMSDQNAESLVFRSVQLPAMFTELRQGAGRLIRSKTDRGVLAILDPRIWTGSSRQLPSPTQSFPRGYGEQAVNAIGFSNTTDDFSLVDRYLARLRREEKL